MASIFLGGRICGFAAFEKGYRIRYTRKRSIPVLTKKILQKTKVYPRGIPLSYQVGSVCADSTSELVHLNGGLDRELKRQQRAVELILYHRLIVVYSAVHSPHSDEHDQCQK